jgi:S-ribosylhomocysteine lyase LuxS involved in autoinducer biosynthesis
MMRIVQLISVSGFGNQSGFYTSMFPKIGMTSAILMQSPMQENGGQNIAAELPKASLSTTSSAQNEQQQKPSPTQYCQPVI